MNEIPDDIWEAARSLRGAVLWESNSAVEFIAKALNAERLAAEQRGREMEREDVSADVKRLLDYLNQNAPVGDEVSAEIGRALLALAGERHKVTGEPFTHPLIRSRTTEG